MPPTSASSRRPRATRPTTGSRTGTGDGTLRFPVCDDLATLTWLANLAALELHVHQWTVDTRGAPRNPDRIVIDLDPGEPAGLHECARVALLVREALAGRDLACSPVLSGSKGLHVVVPIAARWPADQVKGFSRTLVRKLVDARDDLFVATSGPQNRIGRIFVDYLRNGLGATTVLPFSARLRPRLGVSMTIAWDDLDHVRASDQWTVADAAAYLRERHPDPWAGFLATRQGLSGAMKRIGFEGAAAARDDEPDTPD